MKILRFLHKAHSLLFYKWMRFILSLDRFSAAFYSPSMEWVMYRAFFGTSFILLNWYFVLMTALEIILKKSIPNLFDDQLIFLILLTGGIFTFNYFTLIYKKRWFKYDEEFAAYSKTKNKVINIGIFLFYIFSVGLFIGLSLVWANLGHAGKIEGF